MPLSKECIGNMSPIELSNWQKVQGRYKKSNPSCKGNRMKKHVLGTGLIVENQLRESREKHRVTQTESIVCFLDRNNSGEGKSYNRYYDRYNKPCKRT